MENHGAAFRFTSELKDEARVRFGPDNEMKLGGGFIVIVGPTPTEVEPAVVEGVGAGAREGSGEVYGEVEAAQ